MMQSNQVGCDNPRPFAFRPVTLLFHTIDRLADRLGHSVPQIVDIEQLRSLPSGTFGRAWADALDQQHLSPLTTGPRRKQLHDGIHVLTGYGVDPIGEAEVQAFLLGAKFHPFNLAIAIALLRPVHRQTRQQTALSPQHIWLRLEQAYHRGRRSQFDPDTWQPETLWEQPYHDVIKQFGL